MKIALLHGAKYNVGDFLIKNRARKLLEFVYPESEITEYYRNQIMSDELVAKIEENDIAVLAGGPAYSSSFFPVLEQLSSVNIPFFAMGMGWFGFDETSCALYNDIFETKMKSALKRIENDTTILGCRDYNSVHVLRNNGIRRAIMTGCPAWYNLEKINNVKYTGPTLQNCNKICISDCANIDNVSLLAEVLYMARDFFGPNKEIYFVIHRHGAADYIDQLNDVLKETSIQMIDISGREDGFEVYDDCDIHIGFRVHAHIYMMSERKLSILIEEDARGGGVNSALGLPNIKAFWSMLGDNQMIHINNEFVVRELSDYLFDLHENNYIQMNLAYSLMREYFRNMEVHIKTLDKKIKEEK